MRQSGALEIASCNGQRLAPGHQLSWLCAKVDTAVSWTKIQC